MKHLYVIILLSLGLLPRTSWGQGGQASYIVTFGFWGQENPVVTTAGNEPYEIGSTTGAVGLVTLQRGSGGTVGDTLSNSFIASGWLDASLSTAESNARYFSFDVPPDPETIINIQSLAFYLYRSPTGPSWYQWEFSTNGFTTPGTRIGDSGRNRPARYGQPQPLDPASPAGLMVAEIARRLEAGLDPSDVAARVLSAIRDDELYIFTHPNMRDEVDGRFAAIQAAMDKVAG